jgi:hypothetical protein
LIVPNWLFLQQLKMADCCNNVQIEPSMDLMSGERGTLGTIGRQTAVGQPPQNVSINGGIRATQGVSHQMSVMQQHQRMSQQ